MTRPRLSAPSAPFLPSETLRELSEAARAAGTGQVLDELWTAGRFLDGTPAALAVLDADLRHVCWSSWTPPPNSPSGPPPAMSRRWW
ncbi:hypothetical protein OG806_06230 [Streptomyces sp. NBC_00882]|uniref:hypothetical protein n=1 Tax=Streptomyces sp. NBC_00882 TaxID=2975856 RepID=UPI0038670B08|nr:hypothetical protein OG806_06230 [Streptomyces sp. NBC_00882]